MATTPVQTTSESPSAGPPEAEHAKAAPSSPMDNLVKAWRELLAAGQADLFDATEAALIQVAYEHCQQNQVRTARVLGITRNTLRTHLKRCGLLGGQDDEVVRSAEAEAPHVA